MYWPLKSHVTLLEQSDGFLYGSLGFQFRSVVWGGFSDFPFISKVGFLRRFFQFQKAPSCFISISQGGLFGLHWSPLDFKGVVRISFICKVKVPASFPSSFGGPPLRFRLNLKGQLDFHSRSNRPLLKLKGHPGHLNSNPEGPRLEMEKTTRRPPWNPEGPLIEIGRSSRRPTF